MVSTFTTEMKFEQQADGENSGTWGAKDNNNRVLSEEALMGFDSTISLTGGNSVLTMTNGVSSTVRHLILHIEGTLPSNRTVTVPAAANYWIIHNATTGAFTVEVLASGGNGIKVQQGQKTILYCDGTDVLAVDGTEKRWWVPVTAMSALTTSGADAAVVELTAGRPELVVYDFDASADESVQFSVSMPEDWDLGTIKYNVEWTSAATDTDGIAMTLAAVAIDDGDTIDVAYGTAIVVTDDAQGTANDLYTTATSAAVTVAGSPTKNELVYYKLSRDVSDGNDDMAEDARVIGINLFYNVLPGGKL